MMPDPERTVGAEAAVGNGHAGKNCAAVGAYDANPGAGLPLQTQLVGQLPADPAKSGLTTLAPMSTVTPKAWVSKTTADTSRDANTTTDFLNILHLGKLNW
jgi:hypothetical protein